LSPEGESVPWLKLPGPASFFEVDDAIVASGGDAIVRLDRSGKKTAETRMKGVTAGDGGHDRAFCLVKKDLLAFLNVSPKGGRDTFRVVRLDPKTLKERGVLGEVKVLSFLRSAASVGDVIVLNHGSVSALRLRA
jgi:hypothetical protein